MYVYVTIYAFFYILIYNIHSTGQIVSEGKKYAFECNHQVPPYM